MEAWEYIRLIVALVLFNITFLSLMCYALYLYIKSDKKVIDLSEKNQTLQETNAQLCERVSDLEEELSDTTCQLEETEEAYDNYVNAGAREYLSYVANKMDLDLNVIRSYRQMSDLTDKYEYGR